MLHAHGATDCPLGDELGHPVEQDLVWRLPHKGPPSSERCGRLLPMGHRVPVGYHAVWVPHDCGQRDCGSCRSVLREDGTVQLRGWERREGAIIAEKWATWTRGPLRGREPVHIIFSPPQRIAGELVATDRGYRMLREELRAVADWVGVETAVAIFHPYRMGETLGAEYGCREGPHWHLIAVARARDKDGDWRDGWVQGNRVAALSGDGSIDWPLTVEEATHELVGSGWVVKNKGKRKSVMATAGYLLSHAGIASISASAATFGGTSPVQTVTWWGYAHDWPVPEELPGELATRFCPVCKEQVPLERWVELEFKVPPEPPPPGAGKTVLEADVTPKRSLKEEWETWRSERAKAQLDGWDGPPRPGEPPWWERKRF